MNESDIQNIIYHYASSLQHNHICPNVCMYAWEADFISATKAGYVHEYEIKISRGDFKNDAKKTAKHCALVNGWRELSEWEKRFLEHPCYAEKLTPDLKKPMKRPNYFWYVCPENLIKLEEVPAHAGLAYVKEGSCWLQPVKNPPKLHKNHITQKQSEHICRSLGFRYWRERIRAAEPKEERGD